MKKKFDLEVWPDGYCDVYAEGQKVFNCFAANKDHIFLKVEEGVGNVEKRPHDPRVVTVEKGDDDVLKVVHGVVFDQSVEVKVVRKNPEQSGDGESDGKCQRFSRRRSGTATG